MTSTTPWKSASLPIGIWTGTTRSPNAAVSAAMHGVEVRVLLVHAVDEHRSRDAHLAGDLPKSVRLDLRPRDRVHDEERHLGGFHAGDRVADEVRVARGVDHVDLDALVDHGRQREVDREPALLFLGVVVERRVLVVHLAEALRSPRQVEHRLGERGLPRAAMADEHDVTDLVRATLLPIPSPPSRCQGPARARRLNDGRAGRGRRVVRRMYHRRSADARVCACHFVASSARWLQYGDPGPPRRPSPRPRQRGHPFRCRAVCSLRLAVLAGRRRPARRPSRVRSLAAPTPRGQLRIARARPSRRPRRRPRRRRPPARSRCTRGRTRSRATRQVVIKTSKGDIKIKLYPKDAPNTVSTFLELVASRFYDGTTFHRVEPGFVIQGGDPLTKDPGREPAAVRDRRSRASASSPSSTRRST